MAYFQLLGAQIAIGAAAIFARYALTGTGPIAASALRLVIGALPLVGLAFVRRGARLSLRREAALAIAGAALAVHFGAWIASLAYTSVAISTLLVTTTPLFTEAYDSLRLKRLPSRRIVAALALAALGLTLIAGRRAAAAPIPGHGALGMLLALAGAVAMAIYFVIVRSAGVSPESGKPLGTTAIVARTYTWAAIALVIASLAAGQRPPPLDDRLAWFGILGMGLVSQLLGHTGLNAALTSFSPTIVSATTLLEPVAAAILAALVFHEAIAPPILLGGLLVLGAVALALTDADEAAASQVRPKA